MEETKSCSKCKNIKNVSEFYKKKFKSGNIGYHSHCKICKLKTKPKIEEELLENHQKCVNCNIIKHIDDFNNRKLKSGNIVPRKDCKSCKNEYNKKYREENLEKIKKQQKEYCKNNRELKNQTFKNRYNNDINFKIADSLRCKLKTIKKNLILEKESRKVFELCSCDNNILKKWFEYLYSLNTNKELIWKDYTEKYEIDHIIPVSSFDLTIKEERIKAFKWSNLRIVTVDENRSKAKKIVQELIDEYQLKAKNFMNIINMDNLSI